MKVLRAVSGVRALAVWLLINAPRPNLLRLMPALTISDDDIDQGLQLLRQALQTARGCAAGTAYAPVAPAGGPGPSCA